MFEQIEGDSVEDREVLCGVASAFAGQTIHCTVDSVLIAIT